MRLTLVNFIVRKKPHGFLYRGKNRIVKQVTVDALRARYDQYQMEEMNMLYLRHPYLTVEQSDGHMTELKDKNALMIEWLKKPNERFARKLTWAEQLSHLRVKDAWD